LGKIAENCDHNNDHWKIDVNFPHDFHKNTFETVAPEGMYGRHRIKYVPINSLNIGFSDSVFYRHDATYSFLLATLDLRLLYIDYRL
jgi:hypothetical protein